MVTQVGQTIKGYELLERIGAGGFGIVFRARQDLIDREVAIKIILPELASKPDFIRRFDAEAQIVARLEHPHITPIYDYWRDPNGAYLVMRYLRGGSLLDHLQDRGALKLTKAIHIMTQIAAALEVSHRNNVIHRDIKPANILLDEDDNAYLADFGIAKNLNDNESPKTGSDRMIGSLDYITPEQAQGRDVTTQTDIYLLGILLYEILTGQHPYGDVPPVQRLVKHMNDPMPDITLFDADVNHELNHVLDIATHKTPSERFSTVSDFIAALISAVGLNAESEAPDVRDQLSNRDRQIINHLLAGLSDREIAAQLQLTIASVKWHMKQLFQTLGVRSRIDAIAVAGDLPPMTVSLDDNSTLNRSKTSLFMLPEPQNPYKGLLAFQSGDARNFYGREEAIKRLILRIRDGEPYHRFLAVVGPSGSGKSSLVKAGLIPALWDGKITQSESWFVAEMLPGTNPIENLEIALKRIATTLPDDLHGMLNQSEDGLSKAIHAILPKDNSELVLIIDQFEELFTLVTDEHTRQHMLTILTQAVTANGSRLRLYITLRADYYDKPLQYTEFGNMLRARMETVLPLDAQQLERAIALPAQQVSVRFETGLIAHIVSEMTMQIGALPLLQYALTELFDRRDGRIMTRKAYDEIGGAVGALANRADDIYQRLTSIQQDLARQMFLRLVTLGEGSEDTRRRATQDELMSLSHEPDDMETVIDTFATYRLLSLDHDPDTRKPTVEVAHEAILRQWKRLRQWLDNSRDDIRQQRQLATITQDWETALRDTSYLLGGSRLRSTERWIETSEIQLTPLEREFVQASVTRRDALKTLEMHRVEREKTLERRSRTILTALVFVFALSTLGAIGLSSFAFTSRNQAQDNFQRAERIRLAAQAQITINNEDDATTTALLALLSLQLGYSQEADAALLTALGTGFVANQFIGHSGNIIDIAMSADGNSLLSVASDATARLWQTQTENSSDTFELENDSITTLAYSADNRLFATGSFNGTVIVQNASTGQPNESFEHDTPVTSLAISPDNTIVATSGTSGTIYLWNRQSETINREIGVGVSNVNSLAFSADGTLIASGQANGTIALWRVADGEQLWQARDHSQCVCDLAFSPNQRTLLSTSFDNSSRLWDVATGEAIQVFIGHEDRVLSGVFALDGDRILTGSEDGTARLWDIDTGLEIQRWAGHSGRVVAVAISPDGNTIYAATDAIIRQWHADTEPEPIQLVNPPADRRRGVVATQLLPDGRLLMMANGDGTLRYWSIGRRIILREINTFSGGLVNDVMLSPTLNTVVTVGNNGIMTLYDTNSGTILQTYEGHRGNINDVAFTSDGLRAITGADDNEVRIWDIVSGRSVLQLGGHTDEILSIVVSEDGRMVLSGSADGEVRLWDIEQARILQRFREHSDAIRSVAFSADGNLALTGSDDRTARLWDTETGEPIRTFEGHSGAVTAAIFAPDGIHILTGSLDQTAHLWRIDTGEIVRNFVGHRVGVQSVAFSNDGSQIITHDGTTAYVWRTSLTDTISHACSLLNRGFTDRERDFFNIDPNAVACDASAQ